jgi:cell division protein FtsL
MMDAFDYAISKDIRNNQVVREIDHSRQRELWRWAVVGSVILSLFVYSAWQHFDLLRHGYRMEQMERARRQEEEINRRLRLQIQLLRAPQRIAGIAARQLRMVEPAAADAVVLQRAVPVDPPSASIVARR